MRQTKIIATFGPSLEDPEVLKKVLERADVCLLYTSDAADE